LAKSVGYLVKIVHQHVALANFPGGNRRNDHCVRIQVAIVRDHRSKGDMAVDFFQERLRIIGLQRQRQPHGRRKKHNRAGEAFSGSAISGLADW